MPDEPSVKRNLTDRSEGWFSSLYTRDSTREGRHSPRNIGAEKGMIPGVGYVHALESRLDLVQVYIALGLTSLA